MSEACTDCCHTVSTYSVLSPVVPFLSARLDTAEYAELQAQKHKKKDTPEGWEIFNQKSLYNAYMKRTQHVSSG